MNRITKYIKTTILLIASVILAGCSASEDGYRKEIVINPDFLPVASFTASATSITEGDSVTFTDTSTNNPTLWSWSLGGADVTISNEQNVVAIYNVPGVYDVALKVRNDEGANEIILEDFITVEGKPIPYISLYGFDSNLDDSGSNAITAVSNFGAPTYVEDRNSTASSAWESPNTADNWLTIPGYKGISADGTRTVMARFNTAAGTSRKTLVSWGTNASGKMFNVMLQGGQIRVEAGACSLRTSRTDLMDGKWHHVAVTFDPADGDKLSDAKVFIDGVLDANLEDGPGKSYRSTTTIIDTDSNAEVRIGNSIYASNRYFFNGIIDDVAILDVILIPEQIKAIAGE